MAFINPKTAADIAAENRERDKQAAISKATDTFNNSVVELVKGIPNSERESWTKQEHEARNVLADPSFQAPYLSTLAENRGLNETVTELAQKVIDNVAIYETEHAKLLGTFQAELKRIEAEYQ